MEALSKREMRIIDSHYKRKLHNGKNTFARWIDYVAFRLLILAAVYLALLPITENTGLAASLAVIVTSVACVALELYRGYRSDMFVAAEKRRMAERYVLEELTLMEPSRLAGLAVQSAGDAHIAVRQRIKPLDENDMLEVYREMRSAGATRCALVVTASLTAEAQAFIERLSGMEIRIMGADTLLKLAEAAGVFPDDDAINAEILREHRRQKEKRRQTVRTPFTRARTRRYLILGVLLTAASFVADYALYYRLLGGMCFTFAAISRFADRG